MRELLSIILCLLVFSLLAVSSSAKVDLVTLPSRDYVQLTIYNSEDLTFVRERRVLTLRSGINMIQFSWASTLIDPSSIEFKAIEHADRVEAIDTIFPADASSTLVWTVKSDVAGPVLCEISYFISGISWSADCILVSDASESRADMDVYVKVTNNSGEDYLNTEVRLVVGKIHLVEAISTLAGKMEFKNLIERTERKMYRARSRKMAADMEGVIPAEEETVEEKSISKEGLSEYFLYTVEGREDIEDKWSKRMRSLSVRDIPIKSLFRFDIPNRETHPVRYYTFRNDTESKLGSEPLPDGVIRVYRKSSGGGNLSFIGSSEMKYVPVGQTCEVNLGVDREVEIEPVLMGFEEKNHTTDAYGNINGWDEIRKWKIGMTNYRDMPVVLEIRHRQNINDWMISTSEKYERYDAGTVKFMVEVPAGGKKDVLYDITTFVGERVNNH